MTDNKKRKVRSLKAVKAKYLESHPKIREWIEFTIDDEPDAKKFRIHSPLFQTNEEIAKIFSYGGGIGVNISNLRPKASRTSRLRSLPVKTAVFSSDLTP